MAYSLVFVQIVGPRNTGKSSLLQYVFDQQNSPNMSYINCRVFDASSPSGMAKALAKMALPSALSGVGATMLDALKSSYGIIAAILSAVTDKQQTPFGELSIAGDRLNAAFAKLTSDDMSISGVIEAYSSILRQRKSGTPPVLVIDEANVLMGWDSGKDLDTLLRFFVQATKESKRAHVVLATSEYGFDHWLRKGEWVGGRAISMHRVGTRTSTLLPVHMPTSHMTSCTVWQLFRLLAC